MSFEDCVDRAMDDGQADRERGRRAQEQWRELSDRYERQGYARHLAEALAAEDVKAGFAKEAGEIRHVYLARIANMREVQQRVGASNTPDMSLRMERMDYEHRGLIRRFNGRLSAFLKEHGRDLAGRTRNPAQMRDIVAELSGESTGSAQAKLLADGIRDALEDMRIMFNDAGGTIGKMELYDLPHSHNRLAVTRAGKQKWTESIRGRIDWTRVIDPLTGKPLQRAGGPPLDVDVQDSFLSEVYDNIAFGKESREAVYGRPQGTAMYRRHSEARVLHFRSADDWIAYNRDFGSGDPFQALMSHVHRMARDIVLMRAYGPNPGLGVEYEAQLWRRKARNSGDEALLAKAKSDTTQGMQMFRVLSGGSVPQTALQDWTATFFSSARHLMTAAMLDRAIVASIADINSMRLAASAVGMNPSTLIQRHMDLIVNNMSREDALRAGWIADTLADAGTALARFQQEWAPADFAERISSASMRVQGLAHWTDMARVAFQQEMAGLFAANAGRSLNEVDAPLRALLRKWNVTEQEWLAFTKPEHMFKAGNGATFASPIWWREATDLPRDQADEIFFKIQGLVEEQMEFAVPTQSLMARGAVDPAAFEMPPGSLPYELMKSGLMFKSFAMTFSVNQYRRIMAQPTISSRIGYAANLAAGATIMGALAIQVGELAMGRDPQDMTQPMFWGRAAMKGGGFGILGDIVAAGQASWGGGFASYLAGPVPQAINDVFGLTVSNAFEMLMGEDTNFAQEVARFGKRYTPMGQTPLIGPALDRMFWDQLQLFLDPDSVTDMQHASQRRTNLYGNGEWWLPGDMLPSRAPDLGTAIGR